MIDALPASTSFTESPVIERLVSSATVWGPGTTFTGASFTAATFTVTVALFEVSAPSLAL